MRQMLQTMKTRLLAGEDLVMVTVTASSGATPRGAGARMLVNREGRICGTIGGGAVEFRSIQMAQQMLLNLGYLTGAADGIFGVKTEAAVRRFQRAQQLAVDGVAGRMTWAAIERALA